MFTIHPVGQEEFTMAKNNKQSYRLYEAQAYIDNLKQVLGIKNESEVVRFAILVTHLLITRTPNSTLRAKNILKSIPQVTLTERLQLSDNSSLGLSGKDTRSQLLHAKEFLEGEIVVLLQEYASIEQQDIDYSELAENEDELGVDETAIASDEELLVKSGYIDKPLEIALKIKERNDRAETERLQREAEQAEKERIEAERKKKELKDKRRKATVEKEAKLANEKAKKIKEEKEFLVQHNESELNRLLKIIKKGYGYYLFETNEKTKDREAYIIPVKIEVIGPSNSKIHTDTLYKQYLHNRVLLTPVLLPNQVHIYNNFAKQQKFNFTVKGDTLQLKSLIRKLVDVTGTPFVRSGYISDSAVHRKKYFLYDNLGLSVTKDFKCNLLSPYSLLNKTYKFDIARVKTQYYKDLVTNVMSDTMYKKVENDDMTASAKVKLKQQIKIKMTHEVDFYLRYKAKYNTTSKGNLYRLLSYYK